MFRLRSHCNNLYYNTNTKTCQIIYALLFFYKMENSDEDDPLLPKEQSDTLFWISFLIGFTAIYAFNKKKYDIFVICVIVLITSLNHWRDPKFGFRRNIDILAVLFGFFYIFARAIIMKITSPLFWICYIAVVFLYPFGWYVKDHGYIWGSACVHCLLHLCGNASVVLFCGI